MVDEPEEWNGRRATGIVRVLFVVWVLWAFISPAFTLVLDEAGQDSFYHVMTWTAAAASLLHLCACLHFRTSAVGWPVLADSLFISSGVMLATSLYYFTYVGPVFSVLAIFLSWRTRRRALRQLDDTYGPM